MTGDGGLQDAVDAARTAQDRAGQAQVEQEARRRQVQEAGRSFAARLRAAGIQPDVVQVQSGWEDFRYGRFGRKIGQRGTYASRRVWVVRPHRESERYDAGERGVYVLEDGTVIFGRLEDGRHAEWPQFVLPLLGGYLLRRNL